MYKLYTSINFDKGSKTLDEIRTETISDIALAIAKVVQDNEELGAVNFTWTLVVPGKRNGV